MYVAVQRVRSLGGISGINAFLFLHGSAEVPGVSWAAPDVDVIANEHPGALVLQRVEQPSGGNDVLSYLDIAASDSIGIDRLANLLIESPAPRSDTSAWSIDIATMRFVSRSVDDPVFEFNELRKHAVLLLDPARRSLPGDQQPSTAILARDMPGVDVSLDLFLVAMGDVEILAQDVPGVGVVYRLGALASERFLNNGVLTTPATVHVAYEDVDVLKRVWAHGEYHEQIALALTGISRESLHRLGGYRIEHRPEQPPALVVSGREVPGQLEGYWIGPQAPPSEPAGWPTGAVLRSSDGAGALDLVFIEQAWFPLSEAALYTYQHTTGLQGGERWHFLRKGSGEAFEVAIGPSLTRDEVARRYGREASARSRSDYKTVQLLLRPLPR